MSRSWKMLKETITKEDGRYLIYYRFPERESAPQTAASAAKGRLERDRQDDAGKGDRHV